MFLTRYAFPLHYVADEQEKFTFHLFFFDGYVLQPVALFFFCIIYTPRRSTLSSVGKH